WRRQKMEIKNRKTHLAWLLEPYLPILEEALHPQYSPGQRLYRAKQLYRIMQAENLGLPDRWMFHNIRRTGADAVTDSSDLETAPRVLGQSSLEQIKGYVWRVIEDRDLLMQLTSSLPLSVIHDPDGRLDLRRSHRPAASGHAASDGGTSAGDRPVEV